MRERFILPSILLTLWACGDSAALELRAPPDAPARPVEIGRSTRAVARSGGATCAIVSDGTVECWGQWIGFVGSRTHQIGSAPTPIAGVDRAVAIAVAPGHACAARDDGAVLCWGFDSQSQLGVPRTEINEPYVFVDVARRIEGIDDATDVAVGWLHSCALRRGGTVVCWGSNGLAALGDVGRAPWSSAPLAVEGLDRVVRLEAATAYTCAIQDGGELSCWGECAYDACGVEGRAQTPRRIPAGVPVRDVAIGVHRIVILGEDGSLASTGIRKPERTEMPTYAHNAAPEVFARAADAVALSGGADVTCVRLAAGGVSCLGDDRVGALGRGQAGRAWESTLTPVVGLQDIVEIAVGAPSCARDVRGALWCWGPNASGQIGTGAVGRKSPADARPVVANADAVASGVRFACAVHGGGAVSCWGDNAHGQLGDGTTGASSTPVRVHGITDAVAVAVGGYSACAVHASGEVSCWGDGARGQRGSEATTLEPQRVPGVVAAVSVVVASDRACALDNAGATYCWGANELGQAIGEPLANVVTPTRVLGLDHTRALALGSAHSCALERDGRVLCWGQDRYGQMGIVTDPSAIDRAHADAAHRHLQPRPSELANAAGVTHIAALGGSVCFADTAGARCRGSVTRTLERQAETDALSAGSNGTWSVLCMREGSSIRCDAGGAELDLSPMGPPRAVAVGSPICVLGEDRAVRCTGSNERGELGDSEGFYASPQRVRL